MKIKKTAVKAVFINGLGEEISPYVGKRRPIHQKTLTSGKGLANNLSSD